MIFPPDTPVEDRWRAYSCWWNNALAWAIAGAKARTAPGEDPYVLLARSMRRAHQEHVAAYEQMARRIEAAIRSGRLRSSR